jgi:hypothetical protein
MVRAKSVTWAMLAVILLLCAERPIVTATPQEPDDKGAIEGIEIDEH